MPMSGSFKGLPDSYLKGSQAAIAANSGHKVISGSWGGVPAGYATANRPAAPVYSMAPSVSGSPIPKGYTERARAAAAGGSRGATANSGHKVISGSWGGVPAGYNKPAAVAGMGPQLGAPKYTVPSSISGIGARYGGGKGAFDAVPGAAAATRAPAASSGGKPGGKRGGTGRSGTPSSGGSGGGGAGVGSGRGATAPDGRAPASGLPGGKGPVKSSLDEIFEKMKANKFRTGLAIGAGAIGMGVMLRGREKRGTSSGSQGMYRY